MFMHLGFLFDANLSFDNQVKTVVRSCFFQLRSVSSPADLYKIVSGHIFSQLNYCDAIDSYQPGLPPVSQNGAKCCCPVMDSACLRGRGSCSACCGAPGLRKTWLDFDPSPFVHRMDTREGTLSRFIDHRGHHLGLIASCNGNTERAALDRKNNSL